MAFSAVNWLAVILATVASMALGFAWYMGLSRQWLAASGRKAEEINSRDPVPYIITAICQLIMAYFVALLTFEVLGSVSVLNGITIGFYMWLGFVITSLIINHRYQDRNWSLTLIDGGYLLGVLLVQGIVIGLFG